MKPLQYYSPKIDKIKLVFCGDGNNMPPAFEPVIALTQVVKDSGIGYETIFPAHWEKPLDPELPGQDVIKWYMLNTKIAVPVVAWIYVPQHLKLSKVEMAKLILKGEETLWIP